MVSTLFKNLFKNYNYVHCALDSILLHLPWFIIIFLKRIITDYYIYN
jgi:hypothetical protein